MATFRKVLFSIALLVLVVIGSAACQCKTCGSPVAPAGPAFVPVAVRAIAEAHAQVTVTCENGTTVKVDVNASGFADGFTQEGETEAQAKVRLQPAAQRDADAKLVKAEADVKVDVVCRGTPTTPTPCPAGTVRDANGNCVTPPTTPTTPIPPPSCSLTNGGNITVGTPATFAASGGNGSFTWSAPGATPSSGSGSPVSTIYNSAGFYTVTVSSAGMSNTCSVNVVPVVVTPTPAPSCTLTNGSGGSIAAGTNAVFAASGGNGSFTWSAPGGSPTSGSGSTFSSNYSNSGSYAVIVSSAGMSNSCSVNVTPVTPTCSQTVQNTVNIGYQGGPGFVSTTANRQTCSWTAVSNDGVLSLVNTSGTGSGDINFNVTTANPSTTSTRTLSFIFRDANGVPQTVNVVQAAAPATPSCSYSTQQTLSIGFSRGPIVFSISQTGTGCGQWTVTTNDPGRLDLSPSNTVTGTGAQSVNGSVGANGSTSSRQLHVTLTWSGGTIPITVTQDAHP